MSLVPFVQIVARGKSRSRPLTYDEAKSAMALMLDPDTPREATGALLMVLRMRGETAAEIAGFAAALATAAPLPDADLDWPSYAAGRTRGAPLFLLSAKLVAQAGYRVALHGYNSHQSAAADVATTLTRCNLLGNGLSYTPLSTLSPPALRLLRLRETLGLRSCVNTVLRVWNPSNARASVQGVFHPSYRSLQAQAGQIRGAKTLSIIKGGGGEFERHPSKSVETFGLRNGAHFQTTHPPLWDTTRRLHDPDAPVSATDLWFGHHTDPFATATITGTAALALWSLNALPDIASAQTFANDLWATRHTANRISA
jgi:anthranilate phosphoribosyltransferase